ncbi:MAG: SCP2 sterol-binding domain-containing protein [Chloroflexi bacterium]|nr:SCP2 sterol-binding domain-containing protein [Chloroflexota bacterium]MCY3581450.1 SCP2 sterol-binding domain-containing protein [Chloroflexota bacterium]MCY3717301.1 SCP2 sterol-binding domain-containing protein [Chloroflexota bacterium]MDE2649218.1 SCP2 sterol-binding domain-containing protein [Chloroflexota bacterium]MXX51675.1 SCP2 sterol-binding domain-containing protein [Chloroflexota bacterium]
MAEAQAVRATFAGMVERFAPEKAAGLSATIAFNLRGDNGGLFWIKIADGAAENGEGGVDSADMTVHASADDWFAVATGELNPMQAFMTGKLKIQGDMGLAMKMQSLFSG